MENMENTNVQENVVENQENTTTTETKEVDYGKLEEIINKGIQQKESSILKSYFQQVGMEEDEVKQAIQSYKENKAKQEELKKNNTEELNKELNDLKTQLSNERLNNAITLSGYELGLDSKSIKAISKLANFDGVMEDGKINEEKIKESINVVLNDYPGLKTVSNSTNSQIVEVGAPDGNDTVVSAEDDLRKCFGLKPKKIK